MRASPIAFPREAGGIFCLGCGYELNGLHESKCPECGRRFDPVDSATFADRPRGVISRHMARTLSGAQWIFVVLSCGGFAPEVNYLLAWAALWREPVPMIDDPKYISGIGWFHTLR